MSTLTISTIQSQLYWEDKAANLAMFEEKISKLQHKTELIILPEMFSTGFTMNVAEMAEKMDGPTVKWMRQLSRDNRVIITGSVIIEDEGRYFNRLIWVMPNGDCGYYDKKHLFAFAGEDKYFHPGNKRLIASVKGWRVNLMVCYDLRFPVWSRQSHTNETNEPEYDLLIYVANWPARRSHAWKTLLCARAIENQSYVVGVNRVGTDGKEISYSGDSLVIDPLGEVLYHMQDEEDIFTVTLDKQVLTEAREKFPFLRDRDRFFLEDE